MEHLPLSVRVPIELDNPSICRKNEYFEEQTEKGAIQLKR